MEVFQIEKHNIELTEQEMHLVQCCIELTAIIPVQMRKYRSEMLLDKYNNDEALIAKINNANEQMAFYTALSEKFKV